MFGLHFAIGTAIIVVSWSLSIDVPSTGEITHRIDFREFNDMRTGNESNYRLRRDLTSFDKKEQTHMRVESELQVGFSRKESRKTRASYGRTNYREAQEDETDFDESVIEENSDESFEEEPIPERNDGSPDRQTRPPSGGAQFSYENPERWGSEFSQCSGKQQSPINLDLHDFRMLRMHETVIWTGHTTHPDSLMLQNNGQTVQLNGTWNRAAVPFITGGPLQGDYVFSQLHFHWGPDDSHGSEHTINDRRSSMEMHIVHFKKDYGTMEAAQSYHDGLAVFSALFEISEEDNPAIGFMEDGLRRLENVAISDTQIKPFPLSLFYLNSHDYISYQGSLTSPPCLECVTWLLAPRPLIISRNQLALFRRISSQWEVNRNYRPLQRLNGRSVWYISN